MIFRLRRRGGGLVVAEGVIEGHLGLAEYRRSKVEGEGWCVCGM